MRRCAALTTLLLAALAATRAQALQQRASVPTLGPSVRSLQALAGADVVFSGVAAAEPQYPRVTAAAGSPATRAAHSASDSGSAMPAAHVAASGSHAAAARHAGSGSTEQSMVWS
jgi:hypothetical protein